MKTKEILNRLKRSPLAELVSGTAAAITSGVLFYDHLINTGALEPLKDLPVWDAEIISDPAYAAINVALATGVLTAVSINKLRNYLINQRPPQTLIKSDVREE